jgi:hypothetical protein
LDDVGENIVETVEGRYPCVQVGPLISPYGQVVDDGYYVLVVSRVGDLVDDSGNIAWLSVSSVHDMWSLRLDLGHPISTMFIPIRFRAESQLTGEANRDEHHFH